MSISDAPVMTLVGGPFDGASGPCGFAGEETVWITADPNSRARNGLTAYIFPRPGTVRYDLEHRQDIEYVYFFDGPRGPVRAREELALA